MPVYPIPDNAGPFVVARSPDGSFNVAEAGEPKGRPRVVIPCRDEQQANDVRDQLAAGDHGGSVQVDLFKFKGGDR